MNAPSPSSEIEALPPEKRLVDGRYELLSVIGEGGFGIVYKARQVSTGQVVAVKVLHADLVDGADSSNEYVARFEREMKVIGQLKHPNLVRLLDQGRHDGELYMVLEFIDGESLAEVLRQEGPLGLHETLHLMSQVLDALYAAHTRGIVHRDLKPQNIMLTATGYRRNAMVLDFGIAGVLEAQRGMDYKSLTKASEIRGTPSYMAPEQVQVKTLTPQSDLYAWGLVFLECLTGRPIVTGSNPFEVAIAQVTDEKVPIPEGLLSDDLLGIIGRACAKPLDQRYVSAGAVFADLDRSRVMALASLSIDYDEREEAPRVAKATADLDPEDLAEAKTQLFDESIGLGTGKARNAVAHAETAVLPEDEVQNAAGRHVVKASAMPTPVPPMPQMAVKQSSSNAWLVAFLIALVIINVLAWLFLFPN